MRRVSRTSSRAAVQWRICRRAPIVDAISQYREQRTTEWQAEIFEQRRRHADAERKLAQRVTKAAQKELQVSADKVEQRLKWLNDFRDADTTEEDGVMYPMHYGPLIIESDGERKITPMRYHCRFPGHAPDMDKRLMGNYNARIDSLEQWWRPVFGKYHGLLVLDGFRENVKRHDMENRKLNEGERPENVVLQFNPQDATSMLVPCIWSRWQRGDEVLYSMELITDEPQNPGRGGPSGSQSVPHQSHARSGAVIAIRLLATGPHTCCPGGWIG